MVPSVLTAAVPLAAQWVEEQERLILRKGVALTNHQAFDAHMAGVKDPGRVRVLKVDFIPIPENPVLRHGIYVRSDMREDRALFVHELVHVGQYECYGSIEAFLRDYLDECLSVGYPHGPLEQEAVGRTKEICG